ncbi:hypothetical protein DVA86_31860 [Streptomyces armeniacus]|uniref:Allene oxide cyclase barrel-like domain-containing protein n=1 Tax=Streptomyces armeniacus TaxID=83291 RepID=A0A345XXX2_9ACTN|nr:hypothetical protein [Streptomyces armeniacus]AXK36488.1 hypothetical protein DVA86_31860 [Streptomyces armeniacus]
MKLLASRSRRSLALAVALTAALAGTTAAASSSSGDSAPRHGRECFTQDNVTEATIAKDSFYTGGMSMQPGAALTYRDEIYDKNEKVVGELVGIARVIKKRHHDGHIITQYHESVKLADGTFRAEGYVDRNEFLYGATNRLKAVGTSGKFEGWKGYRQWKLLPPYPPQGLDSRLAVKIVLCNR